MIGAGGGRQRQLASFLKFWTIAEYCRTARADSTTVHAATAVALFAACEQAGVRRVIYFSAIGVDHETPTVFSASKRAGDEGYDWG